MSLKSYLPSLLSIKKFTNRRISPFAIWDSSSSFTNRTELERGVRMKNVQIGRYSRLDFGCTANNVRIGHFTAIGPNSVMNLGSHPTCLLTTHSIFYKKGNWGWHPEWASDLQYESMPQITIGNDVWIGRDVKILGGVTIGDGCIIATGAVVTKDLPPFCIAGGVPAKVIKYRFSPEIIDLLLKLKWWNWTDEEISNNIEFFHKKDINADDIVKYIK